MGFNNGYYPCQGIIKILVVEEVEFD